MLMQDKPVYVSLDHVSSG